MTSKLHRLELHPISNTEQQNKRVSHCYYIALQRVRHDRRDSAHIHASAFGQTAINTKWGKKKKEWVGVVLVDSLRKAEISC